MPVYRARSRWYKFVLSLDHLSLVCSSSRVIRRGAARLRENHRKSKKRGVPDPPYCCQSGVLLPRSEYMPLTLSSVSSLSLLWEYKSQTKHVNTCSYDFRAPATVELRVMGPHYIDRGRLYELNSVKNIILCGLYVEILNVHVFAPQHGWIY